MFEEQRHPSAGSPKNKTTSARTAKKTAKKKKR
jgi:hypothetical protein